MMRPGLLRHVVAAAAAALSLHGCGGGSGNGHDAGGGGSGGSGGAGGSYLDAGADADAGAPGDGSIAQSLALVVSAVDPTFATRDHFIASVEMQLSGEPFAEAMGRDLSGYTRNYACQDSVCSPSVYADPAADPNQPPQIDLAGYSSGIESYEYSKQPMNNIAFESGAGTSLLFGPVLNPAGATGTDALALGQTWFQHMATGSNLPAGFFAPIDDTNRLGWRGLWPVLQPFASWNPAINPTNTANCSLSSDDNPGNHGALLSDDYECDYTTLNLPDRDAQVTKTIGPGSSGWTDWKEALWTLNYLQIMHHTKEGPVETVPEDQLASVGLPGNLAQGWIIPGVYLGSSNIEGFQAGNFIQILDNQAAQWLLSLTTTDGSTLSGFASLADALAYGPASPLRWFPASIAVSETADASGFARPDGYTIASPDSHLLDLAGLLGAYASAYALTDQTNSEVGGSQPVRAYFDGDPFPVQNQTPDGEATLHDRALAMMRVLVVDIDRLHVDAQSGLPVDDARLPAGQLARGTTLSADTAAYTLLALRTVRRSLDSELTLYANTTPDSAGIPTPLDGFPAVGPPGAAAVAFGTRLDQLIDALAGAFYDHLSTPAGVAYGGFDVAAGMPTDAGDQLDAHSAAIRGLLVAYLATGATRFRDRAGAVLSRLESAFYDPSARVYRSTAGDRSSTTITFTPRRFGLLQGALRDSYELIATLPGNGALAALIEQRVGRLNKLVLNGWDDRDGDQMIEWPSECANLGTGPDGQPMGRGGLQIGERTLSGDTGSLDDFTTDGGTRVITTDREHDCVPEISAAKLPSALASSVTFTLVPWSTANQGQVFRNGAWVNP
jgi:hypothetical protein